MFSFVNLGWHFISIFHKIDQNTIQDLKQKQKALFLLYLNTSFSVLEFYIYNKDFTCFHPYLVLVSVKYAKSKRGTSFATPFQFPQKCLNAEQSWDIINWTETKFKFKFVFVIVKEHVMWRKIIIPLLLFICSKKFKKIGALFIF